jgi:predicted phage tail protein
VGHLRGGRNLKVPKYNENENRTYQDLWDTTNAELRGMI